MRVSLAWLAAACSLFLAAGTVVGWMISIGTRLGSFVTNEKHDAALAAQLAVDRQTLAQFAAVQVSIARLETCAANFDKTNDEAHREIRHQIEQVRAEVPRIEGRRN